MDILNAAIISFKKTLKFGDISIGKYEVVQYKWVPTKFGNKIVVITEDFEIFLPPRFAEQVKTKERLMAMNANLPNEPTLMVYAGRDESSNILNISFTPK